jgi:hypothetical protein
MDHVIEACASAAHEANRRYCISIGDSSQPHWEDAPEWQKNSARQGVKLALEGATPEQSHRSWLALKESEGWAYGPVKDVAAKTHPCMLPYAELPEAQRKKDGLYLAVVRAMALSLGMGFSRQ